MNKISRTQQAEPNLDELIAMPNINFNAPVLKEKFTKLVEQNRRLIDEIDTLRYMFGENSTPGAYRSKEEFIEYLTKHYERQHSLCHKLALKQYFPSPKQMADAAIHKLELSIDAANISRIKQLATQE